jgi:hypothetical protein
MKNPKKTRKQVNCGECNVIYDKKTVEDWIGCSNCDKWFHVECTSLKNDVYMQMASNKVSIWLCEVCLPNLVMYLPVSKSAVKRRHGDYGDNGDMEKGLTTLCDKVDAIAVAGREADDRHCASLSLLQAKVSEIAEKSERQMAQVMANMGSQNVQENKPTDYQLSAAVSNRTTNYNRLIITNLPVLKGHRLIDNILALARFIGVELRYSDIDHCNQLSGSHQSNAAPVFVKFVSRWMRDEFYSCYLHCVKGKALTVSMLFRLCEDDNRRIYVSEHLTLHDSTIFREAKRLKRMNLFSRVFTRKGVVSVILLNGDERIPRDAGELINLTIVAENYVPAVADESLHLNGGAG